MDTKQAVEKLIEAVPNNSDIIRRKFDSGDYCIKTGTPPDEYDESYSEICWGWLASGPQTEPVVATFARGDCGNEDYDPDNAGLVIWMQGDNEAQRNANIEQAAKALVNKGMGFGEFKAIVRANS